MAASAPAGRSPSRARTSHGSAPPSKLSAPAPEPAPHVPPALRHFEYAANAADQPGHRSHRCGLGLVAQPGGAAFGASRQGHAELVGDARPVMYQLGQGRLADLIDDSE